VKEAQAAQRPVRSRLGLKVATGPPIVTYGLVALNVAAYLYGMTLKSGQLFSAWGLWPHYDALKPYMYGGTEWWRWISNGFVHEGLLHGFRGSVSGGASGAIFGLIAAYVVIAMTLHLPVQSLVLQAGAWLVIGFFVPGLSWQGHLGGAITGWIVTTVILRLASRRERPGPRPA